jgi:hypothetical protein
LNSYVKNVAAFNCPADKGDAFSSTPSNWSCYRSWGNSYLTMWSQAFYRVKIVTGMTSDPANHPPIKMTEVAQKPTTKIICGDWSWPANRTLADARSEWHNDKGKRYDNMLYGDGHTQFYHFTSDLDNWYATPPPDMNFIWW